MSKTLSAVASTEFDSDVKQAYQTAGMLNGTVTERNGVKAGTYEFRKMGKGLANQKAPSDLVTAMDIQNSLIPVTLENWNAPEWTDIFDQAAVNFDEKQELAQAIAGALGRRSDQLVIDAWEASTPTLPAIVNGGTNLTLDKITQASTDLTSLGVPGTDRFFAASAAGLKSMLDDTTITSADFNSVRMLMSGSIDSFMGFKWKIIETREEGGLSITGNIRSCWAWHKMSVGRATALPPSTRVDYVPERTSWLCNGSLKSGAVVRDVDGLIQIDIDESA